MDSDVVANADAVTSSDDHSDSDPSQCPSEDSPVQTDNKDLHQNRSKGSSLAAICNCYQISDRAGAAEANTVMKHLNSYGLLVKYDDSLSIDRSKLRRERENMEKMQERKMMHCF